ncbi:class I SAM-dependent methyltransferase [Pasteurella multocida]|uniref:Methyltransferase type 11 domain-containing protein n=1 Tax=Pasteurella multocida (strain Pm70) TaxID=272843 RepID=Q9CMW7_PASMU|nr:class I SAM-dependent methyltransferase [Pasteurella multocida]AAK02770.1 unknown [Pasteurella multocida subsp. multocida str. Pm70]AWB54705.1 class I SAM-dependent methyltransferase [Pasteurella multocida]TCH95477.1 class I SAM-dependent methyltransferase [Pasteurella multocida]HDR1061815.1 class I SAM-dependent methyltransferase [Pasteurella multocida]HDR1093544.1 class I SAM-dependent methyltransferase [Pasteurella multocida]
MWWNAKYPNVMHLPHSWQQLQNGSCYCNALTDYFSAWYPKILGHHVLKLGGLSAEIQSDCFLHHAILLAPHISPSLQSLGLQKNTSVIQANLTELPFIEQSIDACMLSNTLNFSQDPHQILREVTRVLREDGYLFLSLFNPFSPLLFKRHLHTVSHSPLPVRHYVPWRILDWLALLNFDILDQKRLVSWDKHRCFPHLIAIVARKRVYPLTLNPQKVHFKKNELLTPVNAFNTKLLRK